MKKVFSYVIPVNPVGKKNSENIYINRKTGKAFISQNDRYKEFEIAASYFLRPKPDKPIDYPVNVKVLYYRNTHRRVDKTNLESAICDVLVKYGILEDDNRDIVAGTDFSRVYYDRDNPRLEIEITPLTEEYEVWHDKGRDAGRD